METNSTFSIRRIGILLRNDICQNRKKYFFLFIGIFAAFLFVHLGSIVSATTSNLVSPDIAAFLFDSYCRKIGIVTSLMFWIVALSGASDIMSPMKTKEGKIAFLMLPITSLEKFIERALIVTVGILAIFLAALLLAEICKYLFIPIFKVSDVFYQSTLPEIWDNIPRPANNTANLFFVVFSCWNHSLFVLGGSFWYKRPFLKTIAAIVTFNIVCGIICSLLPITDLLLDNSYIITSKENILHFISILNVIFIMLTIFNWWLSYYLFKHSQLKARKPF